MHLTAARGVINLQLHSLLFVCVCVCVRVCVCLFPGTTIPPLLNTTSSNTATVTHPELLRAVFLRTRKKVSLCAISIKQQKSCEKLLHWGGVWAFLVRLNQG